MKKIIYSLTEKNPDDFIRFLYIPKVLVSKITARSNNKVYIMEKILIPSRYYDVLKYYSEIYTILLKNGVEYRLGMMKLGVMNKNHYIIIPKSLHREIQIGDYVDVIFDLQNAVFREDVKFV